MRLVVIGVDEEAREYHRLYLEVLDRLGLPEVLDERVPPDEPCPAEALEDLDRLVVGGGPTPAYPAEGHPSAAAAYPRLRADRITGAGRVWRVEPVDAQGDPGEARGRSGPGRTLVERL